MKKVLLATFLIASIANAHLKSETAALMDDESKKMAISLVSGGAVLVILEKTKNRIGMDDTTQRFLQLTTTLYSTGLGFDKKALRDAAGRSVAALGTIKLVGSSAAQSMFHAIPGGIGKALKDMQTMTTAGGVRNIHDDGKTLEILTIYEAAAKPLYERLRDETSVGKLVIHGQ